MTKHTPGPWRVETEAHSVHCVVSGTDADDTYRYVAQDIVLADARLIAAAPELLAAAEAAIAYDRLIQNYARTGQVAVRDDGSGDATGDDLDVAYEAWISTARTAMAKARGE